MSGLSKEHLDHLFDDFTFLPMVDFYFSSTDTDNSGFIEKKEINNFLSKFAKDRSIRSEEHTSEPPSNQEIEETLKKFDTNKDGKLSKKEFVFLVKKCIKEMISIK